MVAFNIAIQMHNVAIYLQRLDGQIDDFDGENTDDASLEAPQDHGQAHARCQRQDPHRQLMTPVN